MYLYLQDEIARQSLENPQLRQSQQYAPAPQVPQYTQPQNTGPAQVQYNTPAHNTGPPPPANVLNGGAEPPPAAIRSSFAVGVSTGFQFRFP